MPTKRIGVVLCAWLGSSLLAQQWSVQAVVTSSPGAGSNCSATGGIQSQYTPIQNGPVAPGGWGAYAGGAAATVSWAANVAGSVAPVGFEVVAAANTVTTPGISQALAVVNLELTIQSGLATPQAGALVLRGEASVDVDNDGIFDFFAAELPTAIPTVVPPTGLVLRVTVLATAYSAFSGPAAFDSSSLRGEFFPGRTAVAKFADGWPSAQLGVTGLGNDRWRLETTALGGGMTPVLLVLGLQATNAPIALGLTQLVSPDAWLPGGTFDFDLPPLPPGCELFAQGLLVQPGGYLLATNSVRAIWF
jgi:hypothetical protein